MATSYVVLWEHTAGNDGEGATSYFVIGTVQATTPKQARELAADDPDLGAAIVGQIEQNGAMLRAVPARNWNGGAGVVKAETTRRIRSA